MWMIQATFNASFYWSNAWGWVDEKSADTFTVGERADLQLPVSGRWVWDEDMEWKQKSRARAYLDELAA